MKYILKLFFILFYFQAFSFFGQNLDAKLLKSTITAIGINAGKISPTENIKTYSEIGSFRIYQSIAQKGSIGTGNIYTATDTLQVQQGFLNGKLFLRINNSNNGYFDEQLKVSIYPNPVADDLNIRFTKKTNYDIEVFIYDLNGKTHFYQKYDPTDVLIIPMTTYRQHFYILRVKSGGNGFNEKILKN
jgi:hypothetical protein